MIVQTSEVKHLHFASTSISGPLMAGTGQYSGQNLKGMGLKHPSYADHVKQRTIFGQKRTIFEVTDLLSLEKCAMVNFAQ